jgi:very-short-patch-repair endonuclease
MPTNPRRKKNQSQKRSPDAIEFARQQRATANEFARDVWQMVRDRRCRHQKFRREYPIPPYTADFCCVELKLVIEVDGEHHFTDEGRRHDAERDKFLASLGFRVLRIPGYDVIRDGGAVIRLIEEAIDQRVAELQPPSPPAPLPQGGEGSSRGDSSARISQGGAGSGSGDKSDHIVQGDVKFEIIDDQMAEVLRRKTDAQRLRSVDGFWRSARAILRAAIVTEHPEWDLARVNVEISRRISNGAVDDARTN